MDPYRTPIIKETTSRELGPASDDDAGFCWVWLGIGVLLVATDARQLDAWGASGSLGMLISLLALEGLVRHYVARIRLRFSRSRARRRDAGEV